MKLSPTEIFKGKKIFFIGGTGFVGKVTLSMLLHNFPDIGKVYVTVRARDEYESLNRFWNSVVTSPTFDPLREKHGEKFEDFINQKVVPVNGESTYIGRCVHTLWRLHHMVALQSPKMGEMVAFRNVVKRIPDDSAVDDRRCCSTSSSG